MGKRDQFISCIARCELNAARVSLCFALKRCRRTLALFAGARTLALSAAPPALHSAYADKSANKQLTHSHTHTRSGTLSRTVISQKSRERGETIRKTRAAKHLIAFQCKILPAISDVDADVDVDCSAPPLHVPDKMIKENKYILTEMVYAGRERERETEKKTLRKTTKRKKGA